MCSSLTKCLAEVHSEKLCLNGVKYKKYLPIL